MSDEALLGRLREISVEAGWAALVERGYPNCFIGGLQVVHPDVPMVGRARTLRYVPFRQDLAAQVEREGPQLNKRAVEECAAGDVLVVDAFGTCDAGFAGDIVLTRFVRRGGAGVVVDGSIRDLTFLRKIALPVYTRATHAAASTERIIGVEQNVPVQIAGVAVLPGDYLLGDAEGVLVIPAGLAEEIVATAAATDDKEIFIRKKLEQGATLYDAYPPNEAILNEYRQSKQ
jgi:regulator of RNase E activity RraA